MTQYGTPAAVDDRAIATFIFCGRPGVQFIFNVVSSWTLAHERYLAQIRLTHPAQNITFVEYRAALKEANERLERIAAADDRLQAPVDHLSAQRTARKPLAPRDTRGPCQNLYPTVKPYIRGAW